MNRAHTLIKGEISKILDAINFVVEFCKGQSYGSIQLAGGLSGNHKME